MDDNRLSRIHQGFGRRIIMLAVLLALVGAGAFSIGLGGADKGGGKTLFSQFVVGGGPIVWFILLPMNVATVYLAIELIVTIRRGRLLPYGIGGEILKLARKHGVSGLNERLSGHCDFVSRAVGEAIKGGQIGGISISGAESIAESSLEQQSMKLLGKVEICSMIGNVAPMIGLLGTVFGMIRAFNILGISGGQPRPDQLAAAISIALVTTFWGLGVAIAALVLHGVFRIRVESIAGQAAAEVEKVLRGLVLIRRREELRPDGHVVEVAKKISDYVKGSQSGSDKSKKPDHAAVRAI